MPSELPGLKGDLGPFCKHSGYERHRFSLVVGMSVWSAHPTDDSTGLSESSIHGISSDKEFANFAS
jgi:hypothetical protein